MHYICSMTQNKGASIRIWAYTCLHLKPVLSCLASSARTEEALDVVSNLGYLLSGLPKGLASCIQKVSQLFLVEGTPGKLTKEHPRAIKMPCFFP